MSKVVEEVVFGKECKGLWRVIGKKGHFKFSEYDDKSMKLTTREHTGRGPFAAQALEAKTTAILASQQEIAKTRDNVSVQAKAFDLKSVMNLLKDCGAIAAKESQSAAGSGPSDDEGSSSHEGEDGDGDGDDAASDGAVFNRLHHHFFKPVALGKAAGSGTGSAAASSGAAAKVKASRPRAASAGSGGGSGKTTEGQGSSARERGRSV